MIANSIFEFSSYKLYLCRRIGAPRQRNGGRTLLAKILSCQPAFVTQVLNGNVHFSLEQIEKINRHLGHDSEEGDYLIFLMQKERSGTKELSNYFEKKLEKILEERRILTKRLGKENTLKEEYQSLYYSAWQYAAIHIAVSIPGLQTQEALIERFGLGPKKTSEVLNALCAAGLIVNKNGRYFFGSSSIRIGNDSPNIVRHHTNWRIRAIESLDREERSDLHYSGVLCLSHSAKEKIKDRIIEVLKEHLAISDSSSEEELCCYNIDLFSVRK